MPYKNDNPDELFQRAAKDYPLKTDNSDWERLAAKLNSPVSKTAVKGKTWKYALIVLLLAGGSILLYKLQNNSINIKQQSQSSQQNSIDNRQKGSGSVKSSELPKTNNSGISANKPGFILDRKSVV